MISSAYYHFRSVSMVHPGSSLRVGIAALLTKVWVLTYVPVNEAFDVPSPHRTFGEHIM